MNKTLFKILITLLIICSLPFGKGWGWATLAQNLVPNPSFEDTIYCPLNISDLSSITDWYSPTLGTPDCYNLCNSSIVSVPNNIYGYQFAYDGNAYVGISPYYINDTIISNNYVEYIQCKLLQPLTTGKIYELSFYVSLADSISNHGIKNLGAWLSDSAFVNLSNANTISATPQVVSNYILTDLTNWMAIKDTIIAAGGEEYLTIGSFIIPQLDTDTLFVQNSWSPQPAAYYYIDNISVKEVVNSTNILDLCKNQLIIPNIFTPNNDGINDDFIISLNCENEVSLVVYNRWGKEVYNTIGINKVSWSGSNQHNGTYYYVMSYVNEKKEKIIKKGFVQLLR